MSFPSDPPAVIYISKFSVTCQGSHGFPFRFCYFTDTVIIPFTSIHTKRQQDGSTELPIIQSYPLLNRKQMTKNHLWSLRGFGELKQIQISHWNVLLDFFSQHVLLISSKIWSGGRYREVQSETVPNCSGVLLKSYIGNFGEESTKPAVA